MRFDLDVIDAPVEAGGPRLIALRDIDEDPEQPRSEFDDASLAELAATIAERGVKQPVSVRPHPDDSGRWMLNFGARRLRAARLAGLSEIPAFVDEAVDSYDQVIENEQREGLKPLELAMFVQRRLALGESQAEIARRLGRSRQYVTLATALIDAPDWLLDLYRSGRCRGIAELYELRRLHETDPQRMQEWVEGRERVSRVELQEYKASAEQRDSATAKEPAVAARRTRGASVERVRALRRKDSPPARVLRLHGRVEGQAVCVVLERVPPEPAHVTVDLLERSERRVVPLGCVEALQVVEIAG